MGASAWDPSARASLPRRLLRPEDDSLPAHDVGLRGRAADARRGLLLRTHRRSGSEHAGRGLPRAGQPRFLPARVSCQRACSRLKSRMRRLRAGVDTGGPGSDTLHPALRRPLRTVSRQQRLSGSHARRACSKPKLAPPGLPQGVGGGRSLTVRQPAGTTKATTRRQQRDADRRRAARRE